MDAELALGLCDKSNIQVSKQDKERGCFMSFMSKKYKCLILWIFSLLAIIEFFCLIIDQNYDDKLFEIFKKYVNNANNTSPSYDKHFLF